MQLSKSYEQRKSAGTQRKIRILTVLGMIVAVLVFLRAHESAELTVPECSSAILSWKDSELSVSCVSEPEDGAQPQASLPAMLSPLFFLPIPINDADHDLLLTIPGVGPKTADQLLNMRAEMGRFSRPQDLLRVHGIGAKKAQLLEKHITFQ